MERDGSRASAIRLLLFCAAVFSAAVVSCVMGPDGDSVEGPPWESADSISKLMDNLEYAYNNMDLDLYMGCFRNDFRFYELIYLWQPQQQDSWGYGMELQHHQNMFQQADFIDLEMEASNQAVPWTGDSTGQSLQVIASFNLRVFPGFQADCMQAAGAAVFIVRVDPEGNWYVWKWYDMSET